MMTPEQIDPRNTGPLCSWCGHHKGFHYQSEVRTDPPTPFFYRKYVPICDACSDGHDPAQHHFESREA